jgi:hypothetical protein
MDYQKSGNERAVILVKALPQPSDKHGETVCVAGLTRDGEWRRLYPVRFRHLETKFKRWEWIEYEWRLPRDDKRKESRNVEEESIKVLKHLRSIERVRFIQPLVRSSTDEAFSRGESLAIIRPMNPKFFWEEKGTEEIKSEKSLFQRAAQQRSFLDNELRLLEPCPYKFFFEYETSDGRKHKNVCHDWETSATLFQLKKNYGVDGALNHLDSEYNERYPKAGMAFVMGTHSQRPQQWLLIGILRLDNPAQAELAI